jgi:hypothetical protein
MDHRAGLDDMGKWKFLSVPGLELRPSVVQPVASRSTDWAIPVPIIYYQGPDFDDMSSSFPCILRDAREYINPGDELLVTEMELLYVIFRHF